MPDKLFFRISLQRRKKLFSGKFRQREAKHIFAFTLCAVDSLQRENRGKNEVKFKAQQSSAQVKYC